MTLCSPSDASASCRTFTPAGHKAPHHTGALAPWLRTSNAALHLQPHWDGLEEKLSSLLAPMCNSQENVGKRAAHSSIIPALKPEAQISVSTAVSREGLLLAATSVSNAGFIHPIKNDQAKA